MHRRHLLALGVIGAIIVGATVPGSASPAAGLAAGDDEDDEDEDDDDDDGPVIELDLDAVVDAINDVLDAVTDFTGGFEDMLIQVGLTLFVAPFRLLTQALSDVLTHVMVSYPDVKSQEVLDVHSLLFRLALALAVPALVGIGFLHLTQRVDGIRPTARLLAALGAGGVAPWLLWYPVELSRVVAVVLQPASPDGFAVLRLSLAVAVVIVVKAILLLAVVLLFAIRDFFLMFFVAAAPLIFLGLVFRHTRQFAAPLVGLFTGFLLIGPLELIAYRLILALLEGQAGTVPHYIWALAGLVVMLGLPYVVLSSGMSLMAPALSALGQVTVWTASQGGEPEDEDDHRRASRQRRSRRRRGNRFEQDDEDDEDDDRWWDDRW